MTIASVGDMGSGTSTASDTNLDIEFTSNFTSGNLAVCVIAAKNPAGSTGNTNYVTGITDDGSNTWAKAYEYTYSPGGLAADGVTMAAFYCRATTTVSAAGGAEANVTFSSALDRKAATLWQWTIGGNPVVYGSASTNGGSTQDPASLAVSGLVSAQYLAIRGDGFDGQPGTYTPSSSWTAFTLVDSAGAGRRDVAGEWMIATGTSFTSDPATSTDVDISSILFVIGEAGIGSAQGLLMCGAF